MDDFDRDQSGRGDDSLTRRRDRSERQARRGDSSRDRSFGRAPVDPRDGLSEPEYEVRPRPSRGRPEQDDSTYREERPSRRQDTPRDEERPARYSDRFRRSTEPREEEANPRSYQSTRDPYDRLRTTARRPPRQVEPELYDSGEYAGYDDDLDYGDMPSGSRRRPGRRQAGRAAQTQIRSMGSTLANPSPEMRPIMLGVILAASSLIILSLLIVIRSGSAPFWLQLHLDAEGVPTVYGSRATIWRLPLFALFTTVMALGLGWWLRSREQFAVQFLAVGTLMIHGLIWVGVITLLW